MPTVRKLSLDEVQALQNKGKGQRKIVEEQYDTILSEYSAGDYGEAELDSEEKRLTIRNRLKAAAQRHGLALEFKRTTGNTIRFRVLEENGVSAGAPAAAATSAPAPAKRKGGRPKKAS